MRIRGKAPESQLDPFELMFNPENHKENLELVCQASHFGEYEMLKFMLK